MATTETNNGPSPIPRGITAGNERGGLYILCYANLPQHRKITKNRLGGEWRGLDIEAIADEIGISKQKVSEWMKKDRLPGRRVAAMIGLRGSLLTYDKLGPFINTR